MFELPPLDMLDMLNKSLREAIHQKTFPIERRAAAARFVASQVGYFEGIANEITSGHPVNQFGEGWFVRFLVAMIDQIGKTPLFDLVKFDCVDGPSRKLTYAHYRRFDDDDGNPCNALRFDSEDMKMQYGRGPRIDALDDMLCDWNGWKRKFIEEELWPNWAHSLFSEMVNDVVRSMFDLARLHSFVTTSQDLLQDIERESAILHRETVTGPANKILVSKIRALTLPIEKCKTDPDNYGVQRVGRLNDQWEVYADPFVDDNELLLWRFEDKQGHIPLHYSMWRIEFPSPMLDLDHRQLKPRLRKSERVTNAKFFRLLRIK